MYDSQFKDTLFDLPMTVILVLSNFLQGWIDTHSQQTNE